MPAMRYLTVSLCFACLGPVALNARAAELVSKPEIIREEATAPLAPADDRLNALYQSLKKERSPESARAIADQIRETGTLSGSATIDMLMANCSKALADKRYGAALDFVDQVTLLQPDYAEGWNRRATIHYLMGNYAKSMSDTARTQSAPSRRPVRIGRHS